jgi:hypothetical protein
MGVLPSLPVLSLPKLASRKFLLGQTLALDDRSGSVRREEIAKLN